MNILQAMTDRKLFAKTFDRKGLFKKSDTWVVWKAFLACLFALPMDEAMREFYFKHTARTDAPATQFREAYVVASRRSGKSLIAALIAVFLACLRNYEDVLSPGETGVLMVLSADRRQARVIFNYIVAFLEVPLLKSLVIAKRKESIELSNRIRIEVHTSNYRSVRGFTIVGAICDELAFWQSEDSANPDIEIIRALLPGMVSVPNALLLGISSPGIWRPISRRRRGFSLSGNRGGAHRFRAARAALRRRAHVLRIRRSIGRCE
jgi:hypothetical protein